MVKIDILKFGGADLIKPGCKVNVKTFFMYGVSGSESNVISGVISEAGAYEIEVIDTNGKRFKTSVQPHTPISGNGFRVKKCSVYGEVVSNHSNALLTIKDETLNF